MARILVGTSGWTYPEWRGFFYPDDLPSDRFLEYYAARFPTTEVNYSFYHLPSPASYEKWAAQVPETFIFSLKASRLITHTKRLTGVEEAWSTFVERARTLQARLGPILLQFPASFQRDTARLAAFLKTVRRDQLRFAFEFRHLSWFTDGIYRLLERHGTALCIADSPSYPREDVLTADFAYLRFHGRTSLFRSSYSQTELRTEARKIKRYAKDGIDVYAYFNNTAGGAAMKNARTLRKLLESEG